MLLELRSQFLLLLRRHGIILRLRDVLASKPVGEHLLTRRFLRISHEPLGSTACIRRRALRRACALACLRRGKQSLYSGTVAAGNLHKRFTFLLKMKKHRHVMQCMDRLGRRALDYFLMTGYGRAGFPSPVTILSAWPRLPGKKLPADGSMRMLPAVAARFASPVSMKLAAAPCSAP